MAAASAYRRRARFAQKPRRDAAVALREEIAQLQAELARARLISEQEERDRRAQHTKELLREEEARISKEVMVDQLAEQVTDLQNEVGLLTEQLQAARDPEDKRNTAPIDSAGPREDPSPEEDAPHRRGEQGAGATTTQEEREGGEADTEDDADILPAIEQLTESIFASGSFATRRRAAECVMGGQGFDQARIAAILARLPHLK